MDGLNIALNLATLLAMIGVGLFLKTYLPSYFEEKGKNLATKEDIEEITEKTEKARQRQRFKEEHFRIADEYLDQFARWSALYHFMAREEGHVTKYEQGEPVWEKTAFEPDPNLAQAFIEAEGTPIPAAILQTRVKITMMSTKMAYVNREIDPTGNLAEKFGNLLGQFLVHIERCAQRKDFNGLVTSLNKASQTRREIYCILRDYLFDG